MLLQRASEMWKELVENAKERKVFFNMGEETIKDVILVNRKK